jgi:hypothetical protein
MFDYKSHANLSVKILKKQLAETSSNLMIVDGQYASRVRESNKNADLRKRAVNPEQYQTVNKSS